MRDSESGDRPLAGTVGTVAASLGAAAVFEVLTVLETQNQAIRATSPWQDDPYNTAVSLAVFTVPALAVLIGLRLLAWRWPGGFDRSRQMVRAAAVMTALAGLTTACEWAAVAVRAHRSSWSGRTGLLIGWAVTAETVAFLAFCVISNAAACFIIRPPRSPARRAAEAAVVSGGVAVQFAIAFHDSLWHLVRGRPLASAADLAVLTLGPGAAAALAAAAFMLWRQRRQAGAPGLPSAAPLPGRRGDFHVHI